MGEFFSWVLSLLERLAPPVPKLTKAQVEEFRSWSSPEVFYGLEEEELWKQLFLRERLVDLLMLNRQMMSFWYRREKWRLRKLKKIR